MAAPPRYPRSKHGASADQLSLADWERVQARDALRAADAGTHRQPASAPTSRAERNEPGRPETRSLTRDGFATRQLLTVAEVARATGLSVNAVYRAIASGELRASKLRGQLRVQVSDIDAWVDAARVPARATGQAYRGSDRTPRVQTRPGRGLRELLHTAAAPG
jgi:excisionase family DNA binding protein